jgi:hypothetical protein
MQMLLIQYVDFYLYIFHAGMKTRLSGMWHENDKAKERNHSLGAWGGPNLRPKD